MGMVRRSVVLLVVHHLLLGTASFGTDLSSVANARGIASSREQLGDDRLVLLDDRISLMKLGV